MSATALNLFRNIHYDQMKSISDAITAAPADATSSPFVIVDVRSGVEVAEMGLIPGAIHVPLSAFGDVFQNCEGALANTELTEEQREDIRSAEEEEREEFKDTFGIDKPTPAAHTLVVYCQSGVRSLVASDMAEGLGFKGVLHYKGGFRDWAQQRQERGDNAAPN